MAVEIRLLGADDAAVLQDVDPDVFDEPVNSDWSQQFLADARHHIIVAIDAGRVIGMITAFDYIHPDKAPELWINEVGVAASYHRRGIGTELLDAMLAHGRKLGCTEAWLGTEEDNVPARGLYESRGTKPENFILYSFDLTP